MPDSDSLYHQLFSHPRMVEELVREFVPEALAAGLDFSRLQRVNPKFSIRRRPARRRESDVIWRLPTGGGTDIYLYLLIEFQSESDWWVAVRTQVYQGLLWQQVIQEKKLKRGDRLPPVLLLVLYNGLHRWSAPTQLAGLIGLKPDSALWRWQPQVRYYLLDMGAFAGDELARRDSLVALLFRLEHPHPPEELEKLIEEVIGWFRQHDDFAELKGLFRDLVNQAIHSVGARVRVSDDLSEVKSMLATIGQTWREQALAEGEVRGEAKGKADALIRLLVKRFGAISPSSRERIQSAELASIECWFDRAIDARDVSSVFEPPDPSQIADLVEPAPPAPLPPPLQGRG